MYDIGFIMSSAFCFTINSDQSGIWAQHRKGEAHEMHCLTYVQPAGQTGALTLAAFACATASSWPTTTDINNKSGFHLIGFVRGTSVRILGCLGRRRLYFQCLRSARSALRPFQAQTKTISHCSMSALTSQSSKFESHKEYEEFGIALSSHRRNNAENGQLQPDGETSWSSLWNK